MCPTVNGDAGPECAVPIDDLLDQAVAAINRGDRVAGTALGEQVLAVDGVNAEAEDLLATPADPGQIRRLTILFAEITRQMARLGEHAQRRLRDQRPDWVHRGLVYRFALK